MTLGAVGPHSPQKQEINLRAERAIHRQTFTESFYFEYAHTCTQRKEANFKPAGGKHVLPGKSPGFGGQFQTEKSSVS